MVGNVNNLGNLDELNSKDNLCLHALNLISDLPYIDILTELDIRSSYVDETTFSNSFSNNKNITMMSLNIQSIAAKYLEFVNLIDILSLKNANPDIFLIQESWIKDASLVNIKGYKAVLNARPSNLRGGGTMIFAKSNLNMKHLFHDSFFHSNYLKPL